MAFQAPRLARRGVKLQAWTAGTPSIAIRISRHQAGVPVGSPASAAQPGVRATTASRRTVSRTSPRRRSPVVSAPGRRSQACRKGSSAGAGMPRQGRGRAVSGVMYSVSSGGSKR